LKKILLIALLLFLTVLCGVILLAVSWLRGWPPKVALLSPALFLGLPLLIIALKVFFSWRARRRYAASVLKTERVAESTQNPESFSVLRQQFKHSLASLRRFGGLEGRIHVDDLPWCLILGPPGSLKNGALAASGLFNSFRDQSVQGLAAEREAKGCDWYVYEKSVYLDVKGVLLAGPDSVATRQEWEVFLELLVGSGRKLPLNGVVLVIPGALMEPDKEQELSALAETLRGRLDSLAYRTDQTIPS
jgi:type VI secretion system protein ImpL